MSHQYKTIDQIERPFGHFTKETPMSENPTTTASSHWNGVVVRVSIGDVGDTPLYELLPQIQATVTAAAIAVGFDAEDVVEALGDPKDADEEWPVSPCCEPDESRTFKPWEEA